jgi:Flp pilus assembly protein CpaB
MIAAFPRLRWVLLVALAFSIGLALYALLDRTALTAPPPIAVLVATRDIQVAEPIRSAMVAIREVPASSVVGPSPALAADLPQVLQSSAREPIYAGEIIGKLRLFGPGLSLNGAPEEALLKKGYALFKVPASLMAMPGAGLQAGDHVMILGMFNRGPAPAASPGGSDLQTSPLVVQTVDPSAVVTYVSQDGSSVTLAVPQAEVDHLAYLSRTGALAFAQVRPDDPGTGASLDQTTGGSLMEQYHATPPHH